jgi:hypothetical protein
VEQLGTQAQRRERGRAEDPLERKVVNREDRRNAADVRIGREVHLLVDGHQSCLPVVGVQHRRPHLLQPQILERRATEHREAPAVVRKVASVGAVEPFAIEELGHVYEDGGHAPLERLLDE